MFVIATYEEIRWGGRMGIIDPHQAIFGNIRLFCHPVSSHVVRFKNRADLKVFLLADRVVHMVMTTGTIHRDTQERLTRVFHRVVEPDVAIETEVVADQEPCGPQRLRIFGADFVSGQHLQDHLIVALIGIQRFDDPIAPAPDMGLAFADLGPISVPVAVTPDIHPMPSPPFPVLGAGQQPVDHLRIGIRGRITLEIQHFLTRGWQANQIEIDAAQQDMARCFGARLQTPLLVFHGNEGVNRIVLPFGRRDNWQTGTNRLLKGPVLTGIERQWFIGSNGTGVDPGRELRELFRREGFALQRHPAQTPFTFDRSNQQAVVGLARLDGRAPVASLTDFRNRIESQVTLLLECSVATIAAALQDRLDLLDVIRSFGTPCGKRHAADQQKPGDSRHVGRLFEK